MGTTGFNWLELKRFQCIGLLALMLMLGGCVFPEKFDVKVVVNPDASYTVTFNGEVASVSHVNLIHLLNQPLHESQIIALNEAAKKMTINTANAVSTAQYLGNGRFSLSSVENYSAGTRTSFLGTLMIDPISNGYISIYAAPLADHDKIRLKDIGLNMRGTLSVTLPENTKLISSNSKSRKTGYFDKKIIHSWKITDIKNEPELVFQVDLNEKTK